MCSSLSSEYFTVPAKNLKAVVANEAADIKDLMFVIGAVFHGHEVLFPRLRATNRKMFLTAYFLADIADCTQIFGGTHCV